MAYEVQGTVEAVWRIECGRITAAVARIVQNLSLADAIAQQALQAAMGCWSNETVPENPGLWLMSVAKGLATEQLQTAEHYGRGGSPRLTSTDAVDAADTDDDLLRLIFTICQPALSSDAQITLVLKILSGLPTHDIARIYALPEAAVEEQIALAKGTLARTPIPFALPQESERTARLTSVLEMISTLFNEGHAVVNKLGPLKSELSEEALRLARILSQLLPEEPETHGLQALLEFQTSRLRARTDTAGRPLLPIDQNPARCDRLLTGRGLAALSQARALGKPLGPYALQAAIAACHARVETATMVTWLSITGLYENLIQYTQCPLVQLNHAFAISEIHGPASAMPLIEALQQHPAMSKHSMLHAVRGDLLARLGRMTEARDAFELAIALASSQRDRDLLQNRIDDLIAEERSHSLKAKVIAMLNEKALLRSGSTLKATEDHRGPCQKSPLTTLKPP
ncbi:DUF6596 domain-containing protein [Pseudomonas sp. PNP]|uniref:RNA polymerase sigma factor n=1 Tax=Pseudomonas sp. PNP TaxID=361819 RepID=UPI001AECA045|nr:DUF6596 domain-containing protein [Pseudomonas sp. PNP]MBP2839312.1 hypothetical protein [Pseudomonas sp. PNP]